MLYFIFNYESKEKNNKTKMIWKKISPLFFKTENVMDKQAKYQLQGIFRHLNLKFRFVEFSNNP